MFGVMASTATAILVGLRDVFVLSLQSRCIGNERREKRQNKCAN